MERCELCHWMVCADRMDAHLKGKKHARNARISEQNERSVIVWPIRRCKQRVVEWLQKYGPSSIRSCNSQRMIVEYENKSSVDMILQDTVKVKGLCLNVEKYTDWKVYSPRTAVPENTSKISYDSIKHVFSTEITFDEQVTMFLSAIQPTPEARLLYDATGPQLNIFLRRLYPMCTIYEFGSVQYGLATKDSDLDVYVDIGEPPQEYLKMPQDQWMPRILSDVGRSMRKRRDMFARLFIVRRAKIPIIRFRYRPTGVSCDMSFKSKLGYHKGELMKCFINRDPRVKPLLMILRYWAIQFSLSGTGRIITYALCCLVIFYLQQPGVDILPPVIALRNHAIKCTVDGWPVDFDVQTPLPPVTNVTPLPELVAGFFRFYAGYDFQGSVMCPLDGKSYARSEFQEHDNLPDYQDSYKRYMNDPDSQHRFKLTTVICLQDPIELNSNATFCTSSAMVKRFVKHCKLGSGICELTRANRYTDLLSTLFTTYTDEECVRYKVMVRVLLSRFVAAETIRQMIDKGQLVKAFEACCLLLASLLRDLFQRLFGLTVTVRKAVPVYEPTELYETSSWYGERLRSIEFQCHGRYYDAWNNISLDAEHLDRETDPLQGLSRLGERFQILSNGTEENLRFSCTFGPWRNLNLRVMFKNNKSSISTLSEFKELVKRQLAPFVELMIPHMHRYNDCLQPQNATTM